MNYHVEDFQLEKHSVCFRKMEVETGFMYNFWNYNKDDYNEEWIFVPNKQEI